MAIRVTMPQLGLTMTEGTIREWLVKEGDTVAVGDALVRIETDKLTSTVASETAGVVLALVAKADTDVPVQGLLCVIGERGESGAVDEPGAAHSVAAPLPRPAAPETPSADAARDIPSPARQGQGRLRISPLARKIAAERGLDCSGLAGSGPGGRIVRKDVLAALENPANRTAAASLAVPSGGRREKMSRIRATIGARMSGAHAEIPAVTHTVKVDVTALLALREAANKDRAARFSVNDFILKAVASALSEHREMLVSLEGGDILHHDAVHIGMAVALDSGLIVPVIRDADTMGLGTLSETARDLAARARAGNLSPDECQGSTFSVSNLGMYQVESFTPIINQPNAAILGVCEIQDELALENGEVTVKKVMRHCLTYDHRLMDGSGAAKFQMTLKNLLEHPLRILL